MCARHTTPSSSSCCCCFFFFAWHFLPLLFRISRITTAAAASPCAQGRAKPPLLPYPFRSPRPESSCTASTGTRAGFGTSGGALMARTWHPLVRWAGLHTRDSREAEPMSSCLRCRWDRSRTPERRRYRGGWCQALGPPSAAAAAVSLCCLPHQRGVLFP